MGHFSYHYKLDEIKLQGEIFMNNTAQRDKIEASETFFINFKNTHANNVYSLPIWYNSQIYESINKDLFHKGLRFIRDFFVNWSIITLQYLQETKNVKSNFLTYETLKRKICKIVSDRMVPDPIGSLLPLSQKKQTQEVKIPTKYTKHINHVLVMLLKKLVQHQQLQKCVAL